MKIKDGVRIRGLSPEMAFLFTFIRSIWEDTVSEELIVTSVTDGDHMDGSLHYTGEAIDIRNRHLSRNDAEKFCRKVNNFLYPLVDAINEDTHIHIEYDPK